MDPRNHSSEMVSTIKDLTGLYNKTNIVDKTEYTEYLNNTLDIIIEKLSKICGPLTDSAMFIIKDINGKSTRIFSKDGINMLNAMEFYNPIQQDIIQAISNIGHSVDMIVGDGSTTTMLFTSLLLKHLINNKQEYTFNEYTTEEIKHEFKNYFTIIKKYIDTKYKYTIQNLIKYQKNEEIKYELIHQQILHSSHGNKNFADTIVELLRSIPDTRLDSISYSESNRSDSPELSIYYPEADYSTTVHTHTPFTNNVNFNTELVYEEPQLLFIPRISWDEIDYIKQLYKQNKLNKEFPLVIFSSYPDQNAIQSFCRDNNNQISVFSFMGMDANNREVPLQQHTIIAIAEHFHYYTNQVVSCFVSTCNKLEFKYGKQLYLYGLIPDTTSTYHPYYNENTDLIEHEFYKDLLIKITKRKQELIESHIPMKQELEWMDDILDNLIIVRKPKLILGGDIYQRNNNKDAFYDTVKSLLPILTEGFYLSVWELFTLPELNNLNINKHIHQLVCNVCHELYDQYILPNIKSDIQYYWKSDSVTSSNIDIYDILINYLNISHSLPIHSSLMIETLFTKIIPIIMMNFTSYVIYQGAINMKEKDDV
jgi:hypothetical protein